MRTNHSAGCRAVAMIATAAALSLPAMAGRTTTSPPALKAHVFSMVQDEQNSAAYFNDGGITGCDSPPFQDAANLRPDAVTETWSAWPAIQWNPWSATAGKYDDGSYCASTGSCLRAQFTSSDKTFTLDTRTTANPLRRFGVDFSEGWDLANDVPLPNQVPSFGPSLMTAALFEVLGSASLSQMGICSSQACPEAREYPAKLWFNDPAATDTTWRIDWTHMRVLRISTSTWYFIADACDGSQVAGLSKLVGARTKPRETNQGYYLVPFFITADKK